MDIKIEPLIGQSVVRDIIPKMIELTKMNGISTVRCDWYELKLEAEYRTTKEELINKLADWKKSKGYKCL